MTADEHRRLLQLPRPRRHRILPVLSRDPPIKREPQYPCTASKCRDQSDLQVSVIRLRGAVVLVDHAADDLPALHRRGNRHDDWLVVIGWPLLPGLVRPVPAIVPGAGPQHGPQMGFAVDQHPVSALRSFGPYPAFGITVRLG